MLPKKAQEVSKPEALGMITTTHAEDLARKLKFDLPVALAPATCYLGQGHRTVCPSLLS